MKGKSLITALLGMGISSFPGQRFEGLIPAPPKYPKGNLYPAYSTRECQRRISQPARLEAKKAA